MRGTAWIHVLGSSLTLALLIAAPVRADDAEEFARRMNVGKAHLENRESAKAVEAFDAAVRLRPKSPSALRNLARAQLLARAHDGVIDTLARARAVEPDAVATAYLTGLAHVRLSKFEEAIAPLEKAVRGDPETATLRFQLAGAYQASGKDDKAIEQLTETVRLDPFHASAHYKLGTYARKAGDKKEFQKRHREFMRLRKLFGDESRSTEALEVCIYTVAEVPSDAAGIKPARPQAIDVRFVDATDDVFASEADRRATVTGIVEVTEDGGYSLLAADDTGVLSIMSLSKGGKFERKALSIRLPEGFKPTSCVVGDFHDDVPEGKKYDPKVHLLNDVLLVGSNGLCLLKRTGASTFADVTEPAGLAGLSARRAGWIDYEHDGDLDLLLARKTGLELWQNNGNATFTNVSAEVAIPDAATATDVAIADLDANVAIDIITARGGEPTLVIENQRAGLFKPMAEPPGPWPAARRVLTDDINNDGFTDAVLVDDKGASIIYSRSAHRERIDLSEIAAPAVALTDYDNDGWLDVLAFGETPTIPDSGAIRVFRNAGGGAWTDVTAKLALDRVQVPVVKDIVPADFDRDGDSDLLLTTSGGTMRYLRNDGAHVNGQLKVRLVPLKSNPTGIGTEVEVRSGAFRTVREVSGLALELGLGGQKRADSVRTLWTNGVVDHQINVALDGKPLTIDEKNVATGSCPFLYAWDGTKHRFVTDILGNAPVGLLLARGVVLDADPDELIHIGQSDSFAPRDGTYLLTVTEEFREALYLDEARLVAVDHHPAVEVHPTDKLMPAPFPPSEIWAMAAPIGPTSVRGDDGIDRTEAVRRTDGVFAPPGVNLPAPLRGKCYPLTLTMDFGPLDATRPYVLAMTGWLQYGDASRNIALSQNSSAVVIPPLLEVEAETDVWQPIDLVVGMPAGKTKTIVCDLSGKLPPGARRLRLTTTFELRWDRIALFERRRLPKVHVHEALPSTADLQYRGFSEIKFRRPGHPTTPEFDAVSPLPPWRTTLQGWCTRYGDVLELVTRRDEQLAIVNAGDGLTLGFAAEEFPPVPPDMVRTFFFYSYGLEKDADHNVVDGDTIEPMPFGEPSGEPADMDDDNYSDWRLKYNTRWTPRDQFRHDR